MAAQFLILLVDDDPNVEEILNRAAASVFPEAKFEYVNSFATAVEYLNGVKGLAPRLVLLDIDLSSDSNGFDFLTLIRRHQFGSFIPIIVLSASQREDDAKQAYLWGANAFTIKPFSFEDWKTYVKQIRDYWYLTVTIPKLYLGDEMAS